MELESPTVDECLQRASELSDTLNNTGYVVFRNANWSTDEADYFMVQFAEHHKWRVTYANSAMPHWVYIEDHDYTLGQWETTPAIDEIFIHWHAEQTNLEFPQHGALWHMLRKSGHPDSGQTGFLDNSELYYGLPEDDRAFLRRCEAVMTPIIGRFNPEKLVEKIIVNSRGDKLIPFKSYGELYVNFVRPIVQTHYRTGKQCIRFNSHYHGGGSGNGVDEGVMSKMILIDGRIPTADEQKRAEELMVSLARRIYGDTSLHTWVKWHQGDLILADLFRMTHAVRGGFTQGERVFRGIWAFEDTPFLPEEPKQIEMYSDLPDDMYITAEY